MEVEVWYRLKFPGSFLEPLLAASGAEIVLFTFVEEHIRTPIRDFYFPGRANAAIDFLGSRDWHDNFPCERCRRAHS
jgi:hypothetical protein